MTQIKQIKNDKKCFTLRKWETFETERRSVDASPNWETFE